MRGECVEEWDLVKCVRGAVGKQMRCKEGVHLLINAEWSETMNVYVFFKLKVHVCKVNVCESESGCGDSVSTLW